MNFTKMFGKATFALATSAVMALSMPNAANAQLTVPVKGSDLSLKFGGRINMDLGTYIGTPGDVANRNGASITDCRLGVIADYDSAWQAKLEISFANKAVSFRDVYVARKLPGSSEIKIGNAFMPIGLKPGGLAYKFIETATPDNAFCPNRKMGVAYTNSSDKGRFAVGFYSDGNIDAKGTNKGYNFMVHGLIRPVDNAGTIFHAGATAIVTHPSTSKSFSAIVPTTINSNVIASTPAMDVYNYSTFEVQALYICRRFYAEAHYLHTWANLPNEAVVNGVLVEQDNYDAGGFYAQASWRITGDDQNYNRKTCLAANPSGKALEVLARFASTDLSDFGSVNDLTVGLNYFFNKNMNIHVNYIRSMVKDGDDYNVLQGRLQFYF